MNVSDAILSAVRLHAEREAPRECCGLLIRDEYGELSYRPCRNILDGLGHFQIASADYAAAEDAGVVAGVVHSHVGMPPEPSMADLVSIEHTRLPWLIVNHPLGTYQIVEPSGYSAPLEGREFEHGVLDCFSLVRDYYRKRLGIEMRDYPRQWEWWSKGENLYMNHLDEEGFLMVYDPPRKHDVVLMQVRSDVPNHAGVYLSESNLILHHLMGQLSRTDIYDGYWRKITYAVIRHRSLT